MTAAAPSTTRPRSGPAALVRRLPVSAALPVALLAVAIASGSLAGGPSAAILQLVGARPAGPLWGLVTSAFWCAGGWPYVVSLLAVPLALAPAERTLGSSRTLQGLLIGQVVGTAMGTATIGALAALGDTWARELATVIAVGPLPGILGAAGMATACATPLWRRRTRLALSITLVALVLYSGTTGDVVRLTGWLAGLAVGALFLGRPTGKAEHPSRREGRALVALVVAVTAFGPLVAAVSRTPDGPWAVLAHLFVSSRPHPGLVHAVCGPGGDPSDCRVLRARMRLSGHGPALLSILPVVLQLVLAEGLRRGRRAAWVAAIGFGAVLTAVGGTVAAALLVHPARGLTMLGLPVRTLPAVSAVAPVVVPLAVLVLLLLTRDRFGVRAAPGAARRWALATTVGAVTVAAGYISLGTLLAGQWARPPSPATLLLDLGERMLPPGYLGEVLPPLVPMDEATRTLAGWVGVAAWAVLLLPALRLLRPAAPLGDAARAREQVRRHGDGALAFMATWSGNRYWFPPDGGSVVAYRVVGRVALTVGDPIGPPETRAATVRRFGQWCEAHGWTPCWYSVTDQVVDSVGPGWHAVQVAVEAWLPLGALSFTGRRWQDVRTARNRAERDGLQAHWFTWSQAPLAMREQIIRLSEEWLAGKGLPEMGFTLGGLDELTDDDVRCLAAVDAQGQVRGLTSWLPAYRDGVVVGWTVDVMRRAREAPPGVMEFLLATAASTFQDEGAEWVSLSGAPLTLPAGAADRGMLTRLLELAGRTMEPVYGFRSLLAFKAKFSPRYRPLWLVYQEPADLPRIARAVSGAYLPHLSLAQAVRLGCAVVQGHRARPVPAAMPAVGAGR